MNAEQTDHEFDYDRLRMEVGDRLAQNKQVRRTLPGGGRLRIDRQLPFLCIYRSPDRADPGTRELVTTEAAYLFGCGKGEEHRELQRIVQTVASTLQEHFGIFLLIEVWADEEDRLPAYSIMSPGFRIVTPDVKALATVVSVLRDGLEDVTIGGQKGNVEVEESSAPQSPSLPSLLEEMPEVEADAILSIGIAVRPIYRDLENGVVYPIVLQSMRRQMAAVLRKATFAFMGIRQPIRDSHHESMGPSTFVKAARLVDQQLCQVADAFDFVLQVTPVNASEAWQAFRNSGFRKPPILRYRPLPFDPRVLKRTLFEVPIEHVEDVTLAHLFEEKQDQLDDQLTALRHLGTSAFRESSRRLYGGVSPELRAEAKDLLAGVPVEAAAIGRCLNAGEVATLARKEIDRYHERLPAFHATVELRGDIASSMMVAQDRLLISESMKMGRDYIPALLHHEVGTHLVTYVNGRHQPFRQLYAGLAGYESLQEGLAVFAEYVTGGLTVGRLRLLAGRVLTVDAMLRGESFVTAFVMLVEEHGFSRRQAFRIVLRVFRGGGFTKDAIYLRGLRELLRYLTDGHDIEPLYVGKIALRHVPIVQELRRRSIIQPPAILPRFWEEDAAQKRLEASRGRSILQLMEIET